MRLGIVIGTFERPAELENTLAGCFNSSLTPEIIVVVDSSLAQSASANKLICEKLGGKSVELVYLHTNVQSVTVQRNMGLDYLAVKSLDFVQILDDDTCPSVDHFSILAGFLSENSDVVGVSGIAPNEDTRSSSKLKRLPFVLAGLDSYRGGAVSRAGVGIPVSFDDLRPQESEWLIGCSMWKFQLAKSLRFDETMRGSCLFDDVDYSIRAREKGRLFVLTAARLNHAMSQVNRPDLALFHYRFSRNRWIVMKSMGAKIGRHPLFALSVIFLAATIAVRGLLDPKARVEYLKSAASSIGGYVDGLRKLNPK
jgi:GT2 family glycosyltransferase